MKKKIGIISYNINNLFSISNTIKKLDHIPVISNERKTLLNCDFLVLPGVGAYEIAMKNIFKNNIDQIINEFIKKGNFFLGICLGYQILFEESNEFKITKGLNLIKGKVTKFDKKMITPHVGWNYVDASNSKIIKKNENKFYFIHSYYATPKYKEDIFCETSYNDFKFCSGVKKENIYGLQFHPEKSGKNGINFFEKFLSQ